MENLEMSGILLEVGKLLGKKSCRKK